MTFPGILSIVIFLPAAAGVVLLGFPRRHREAASWFSLGVSCAVLVLSIHLFTRFDSGRSGMQFVEFIPWVSSLELGYRVGVDGFSLLLVLLTALLTPIVLVSSWKSIAVRVPMWNFLILIMETGMIGVFCALDTFLFYVFWEVILIPMYFIIGVWGGEKRVYAALKFFIFTMAGSLLMLVAILWLGWYASTLPGGRFTTDVTRLFEIARTLPHGAAVWLFWGFAIAFLIKVPSFPLHTWLPDAHVEAPTGGSVILAGILLKMGTYGLVRYNLQMFPALAVEWAPFFAILGIVGIVYGALVAMVQTDAKKLVAYSSVSHMGFVLLGIAAMTTEALQGAILQMVNHGLSTGALFLLVGMMYDRRHTRMIEDFGGLARVMPVFATVFLITALSSIGLPGLNGFVGEFLILLGSFRSPILGTPVYTAIAASGIVLSAVYMLWMYRRVFLGTVPSEAVGEMRDLDRRETGLLIPLVLLIVWIGIYPNTFLAKTSSFSRELTNTLISVRDSSVLRPSGVDSTNTNNP
ncbi:MAG: NADH-quinone oxidoreductase subunit M [Bacteroidota bacterium]|nr:NADH-quinone oxidoreductase subunit M [Bacteroidota bacterium]